jgi:hypothetical protein
VQQEIRVELRVVPRARDGAHIRYSTHAMYQQQVDEFFDRSRGVADCQPIGELPALTVSFLELT